ncbi:hypothetical protein [Derxia lacustris]|uniref:hypothetical protein n=1 Tax=Derxia lacustris TaxID=764842 RepID=UPI000A1756A2|nr:hypothetical protein [Derxia lacustris]
MASYRPLLRLTVEHGYFSDGLCRTARFAPAADFLRIAAAFGGIVRNIGSGIELHYDSERQDVLADLIGDATEPLTIRLDIRFDADFANYTAGGLLGRQTLSLSARDRAIDADGRIRLHSDATLDFSERSAEHSQSARPGSEATEIGLSIALGPDDLARLPLDCVMRFAPRSAYWKYLLVGDWPVEQLRIVDNDGQIDFTPTGNEALGAGQQASGFISARPLVIQQRSSCRFELRQSVDGIDKVMVKRLPVADASHFHRELRDGMPALLSEIYIHC